MKVLVADDDRVTANLLAGAFVKAKWKVMIAIDAMQALMYASKTPLPDVILLDLNMPGGTGYHTLERLRASTRTQMIPVVIITGSTDDGTAARAKDLGVDGFFTKPIDPAAIVAHVTKLTSPGE